MSRDYFHRKDRGKGQGARVKKRYKMQDSGCKYRMHDARMKNLGFKIQNLRISLRALQHLRIDALFFSPSLRLRGDKKQFRVSGLLFRVKRLVVPFVNYVLFCGKSLSFPCDLSAFAVRGVFAFFTLSWSGSKQRKHRTRDRRPRHSCLVK